MTKHQSLNLNQLASVICCTALAWGTLFTLSSANVPSDATTKSSATSDAQQAIAGFQIPAGTKAELYAAEPLMANPCAFCIDEKGRIFVAETHRQGNGVTDNRHHTYWIKEDISLQTVADRRRMYKKYLTPETYAEYEVKQERIVRLVDTNGDGKADKSTVFVSGFNEAVEGNGAGVLAIDGDVYYTCIPKLWKYSDANDDGVADKKTVLHDGYGVRVAFSGHDLHGLIRGPDGRIYFSIGDRGYNVTTLEGKKLVRPDTGAVFRCELDGSKLEVFAYGLRNPQELAFDDYGNLFTCDNNSDSGDRARFVHVVEGGDTGWRMYFQYLSDRGPWNREKMWHPTNADQPAYIIPPITNIADGPSGFVAYPGVGLSERYKNHFFLADFRGTPNQSGIRSFATKPRGASFQIDDAHKYIWQVLATDVDFGYDGRLYLSDWIDGWQTPGRGRIYRFHDEKHAVDAKTHRVARLMAADFKKSNSQELVQHIDHPDRRIRLKAQFELVRRNDIDSLAQAFQATNNGPFARIHAIWGLGQLARKQPDVCGILRLGLFDSDAEVCAQAALVLGEAKDTQATPGLRKLLADDSPRVRSYAAIALWKTGGPSDIDSIVTMLEENNDQDPVLRHAGAMALLGSSDLPTLKRLAKHESRSVRLASLLAMRRLKTSDISQFLNDDDANIVLEAARAINDEPIDDATASLATVPITKETNDGLARRVLNANLKLGSMAAAQRVVQMAHQPNLPISWKQLALDALLQWDAPKPIDEVTGMWNPQTDRKPAQIKSIILPVLKMFLQAENDLHSKAIEVALKYQFQEVIPHLEQIVQNNKLAGSHRARALSALFQLADKKSLNIIEAHLDDKAPEVRSTSLKLWANHQPEAAVVRLQTVLKEGTISEQQQAFALLGTMKTTSVSNLLLLYLKKWSDGEVAAEVQLELVEAIENQSSPQLKSKLAAVRKKLNKDSPVGKYAISLSGGNAARGRDIFLNRTALSCKRCHKIGPDGGQVGPNLSTIGKDKSREYILESIAFPNRAIAKGFESVVIITDDGLVHVGIIRKETDHTLELIKADASIVTIKKSDIDEQSKGKSAMIEDLVQKMSRSELRDLVEFLKLQISN